MYRIGDVVPLLDWAAYVMCVYGSIKLGYPLEISLLIKCCVECRLPCAAVCGSGDALSYLSRLGA